MRDKVLSVLFVFMALLGAVTEELYHAYSAGHVASPWTVYWTFVAFSVVLMLASLVTLSLLLSPFLDRLQAWARRRDAARLARRASNH